MKLALYETLKTGFLATRPLLFIVCNCQCSVSFLPCGSRLLVLYTIVIHLIKIL